MSHVCTAKVKVKDARSLKAAVYQAQGPTISHKRCGFKVMPDAMDKSAMKKAPRWWRERTHGCWCSSWKHTNEAWYIWRENKWVKARNNQYRLLDNKLLLWLDEYSAWSGKAYERMAELYK